MILPLSCISKSSVWQRRRVILTKESISFAFIKCIDELDRIPLSEIDYLKATDEGVPKTEREQDASDVQFVLQVATNPAGHNSGRSYYIRTPSKETYDEFLRLLTKYTKTARERAQASTFVQRAQLTVRKLYLSVICQSLVAVIIFGVSTDQVYCNMFCLQSAELEQIF